MKHLILLFLPLFAQAQSWTLEASYPYPITSVCYNMEGDVFVTNQDGRLFVNGAVWDTLDVLYNPQAEHGLITVAEFDGLLYFHLTSQDSFQQVVSYDPLEKVILDTFIEIDYRYPPTLNHYGGSLIVRDSFIYAGFGVGNVDSLAQGDSGHGAVVRVDLYEGASYVYANGMRNPFRLMYWDYFEELYVTDPGGDWEELNLVIPGGNYGWPILSGTDPTNTYDNPIFEYSSPTAAIIGGTVYNDNLFFTDHFPFSGNMSKGWKLDINGNISDMVYPAYTTCMSVNPVDNTLHLVTWSGKLWKWVEMPLSIDTVDPPEKPLTNKEFKRYVQEIDWYQPVLDILGRRIGRLPDTIGYYYLTVSDCWIRVDYDGIYIEYRDKWIKI